MLMGMVMFLCTWTSEYAVVVLQSAYGVDISIGIEPFLSDIGPFIDGFVLELYGHQPLQPPFDESADD
jgi:hypothetical protein